MNGEPFADHETATFGVAVINGRFPAARFRAKDNELMVRVAGSVLESSCKFSTPKRGIHIQNFYWKWSESYRKLMLRVQAAPTPDEYPVAEMSLNFIGRSQGENVSLGFSKLDEDGWCQMTLDLTKHWEKWRNVGVNDVIWVKGVWVYGIRCVPADWPRTPVSGIGEVTIPSIAKVTETMIEHPR